MRPINKTKNSSAGASSREDAEIRELPARTAKLRNWHHSIRETVFWPACAYPTVPRSARVFLAKMPSAPVLDSWLGEYRTEATVHLDGHYVTVTDDGGLDGSRRTIADARQWLGGDTVDPVIAQQAWQFVEAQVRSLWRDPEVCLLSTPGSTARDLWLRTPAADGCTTLPGSVQTLIRSTAMQGRIETRNAVTPMIGELWEYDLRLAYVACLRGLPVGTPDLVDSPALDVVLAHRSRALVTFRPPRDWQHVGLFAVRAGSDGYSFPTGYSWHGPTWVDGCEIELAVQHGWEIEVRTAIIWPETGEPLRTWADRLVATMNRAESSTVRGLARAVRQIVRSILLHGVGAFVGAPNRVTVRGASVEDAPIGADMLRVHDDDTVSWQEVREPRWPEASHPEWSAHIWAKNRRRLLSTPAGGGALTIDPRTIVAIRTDAIYTTAPTDWERFDTGKPGMWVAKGCTVGPMQWPRNGAELVASRDAR